ncbi:Copper homeostasis protein CutC [Tritrichomonas foetus]|uniref:Copper homeostasis protein cutC homolog n=1 Tax=Tritrichomonas foetus TaxID=1144522 RepID=A0A1J4KA15_9EUKA|nr:Copper homeostasis protein CutC [Tritrichomonas foetus]|eukprot:OHT07760.1 Copper homeostasis protein CutC [Tritrichomonas foetus]
MTKYIIETCVGSAESVRESAKGGADRVELCCSLPEGGCTPSIGEIWKACQVPDIQIMVMIRPRGGDFLYSDDEIEIMCKDIDMIKTVKYKIGEGPNGPIEHGVYGVVFGCLTADGEIDVKAMKKLISHCDGLSVTCHRAFDMCRDPVKGLEDLIEIGCHRVLSSGQKMNAEEGSSLLKKLVEQAKGRIIIMPGCGVDENNIAKIAKETGAVEFHIVGSHKVASEMKFRNEDVSMGGASAVVLDEFKRTVACAEAIKEAREILGQ